MGINSISQNLKQEKVSYNEDGLKEGPYIRRYVSGEVEVKGEYRNGKQTGVWITYLKDGSISRVDCHVNDLVHTTGFYSNGAVQYKGSYKDWKMNGAWVKFSAEGILEEVTMYKNDTIVGGDLRFYENGFLKFYGCRSIDGKTVTDTIKENNKNGSTEYRVVSGVNEKEECWYFFNEDGSLKRSSPQLPQE
ncbi:hypothetical protein DMA11_24160 [Marinilabiliaceae bacterium JC017]|nr:hypothetical protein DMA11_24160 [Marinilabiliaceae bacterium JC017]